MNQQLDFQPITQHRPALSVKLDWKAYYKDFERLHGGDPVVYCGRLLFQDGWTHSATDYRGPEWPPPGDPKAYAALLEAYWTIRRSILQDEERKIVPGLRSLREAQHNRSAQIQQVNTEWNEKRCAWVPHPDPEKRHGPVDIERIEQRLDWVRKDIARCDLEIRRIQKLREAL